MRHTRRLLTVVGLLLTVPLLRAAPPADSDDEKLLQAAKIGVDGPGLLDYFRQHTTPQAQRDHIQALIRRLGDDSFQVRRKATTELAALGPAAVPFLRRSLNDPDEELKERAENLIRTADGLDARAARSAAAARLIRRRPPADAAAVLLAFTPDAVNEEVEEEVIASLAFLAVHKGNVDAVVVAALTDKDPIRRAAAAVVVGRSGTPRQRADVRALLADADPHVRFRAAQGLVAGRDKAGIPALVALVKVGPADVAYRSHELLNAAVGVHAPHVPFAEDPYTRQVCAKAWAEWAKTRSGFVGLSRSSDLPAFNPALRARDTARRFFHALVVGDLNAFKKVAGLPFSMQDSPPIQTADDLANFFNSNPMGLRNGQFTPVLLGATSLQTYFNGPGPAAEFLNKTRWKPLDLVVLVVQQDQVGVTDMPSPPSQGVQGNLFLIRLGGDQPRVVGVSPNRSAIK